MSADFIALFDASAEVVSSAWLLRRVATDLEFGVGIVEQYRDLWQPKDWLIETSPASGESGLLGPGNNGAA